MIDKLIDDIFYLVAKTIQLHSPELRVVETKRSKAAIKLVILAHTDKAVKEARIEEELSTLNWVLAQLAFDGSDQDVEYITNRIKELQEGKK